MCLKKIGAKGDDVIILWKMGVRYVCEWVIKLKIIEKYFYKKLNKMQVLQFLIT